ncbi:MAG TPA: NYN domain-containing protein [Myxococcaceae bacterium]|jgi:uncharacterized LabA/DUF88 family protein
MTTGQPATSATLKDVRVRAFVDFWNFQLAVNHEIGKDFRVDWKALGPWLAQCAGALALDPTQHGRIRYEGMHVYLSFNPKSPNDSGLIKWATTVLDRFPGVNLIAKERRPKNPPSCPVCHKEVASCPHCNGSMAGTVEKGIDTAIVTDMIKLAWADSYDIAVLVSADRDFIPAVEFLGSKGLKVVHAGFPPTGMELARNCWASFDVKKQKLPEKT